MRKMVNIFILALLLFELTFSASSFSIVSPKVVKRKGKNEKHSHARSLHSLEAQRTQRKAFLTNREVPIG